MPGRQGPILGTVPTTSRSRIKGEQSREKILEVAARLMGERGYDGTSLAAVGVEAGVPKSLLLHHFGTKAGLLSAVMTRGAQRFFEQMRAAQAAPPPGGTHAERLGWMLRTTAEVFGAHHDFHRLHTILMMTSSVVDPDVREAIRQVRAEGRDLMHAMVASAFADLGPEVADAVADELDAFGMVGIDGAYIGECGDGRPLLEHVDRLTVAMVAIGEAKVAELRGR